MSEQSKPEEKKEEAAKQEPVKKFTSITAVKSDAPKFDFSGMLPGVEGTEESVTPTEEVPKSARKPRNADYVLPEKLLGKTISSLFSMVGSRYPEVGDQLRLSETEEELIDSAIKPLIDDFLIKSKTKASQIAIILALVAIMLPRIVLIIKAEGDRKKIAKLAEARQIQSVGVSP